MVREWSASPLLKFALIVQNNCERIFHETIEMFIHAWEVGVAGHHEMQE